MGKWRTEVLEMTIHFTTNGERVGRVTGSSGGFRGETNMVGMPDTDEILIAYLEGMHGLHLTPINRQELVRVVEKAVNNYLGE